MKTQVRCNTCKFGDWGVKGPIPCEGCIGFHKWLPKPITIKLPTIDIVVKCPDCGIQKPAPAKCPYTGYEYNTNWHTRCDCGGKMEAI
jgi:hypothetical protein